jgi:hypothetical protein
MSDQPRSVRGQTLRELSTTDLLALHEQLVAELPEDVDHESVTLKSLTDELALVSAELDYRWES